VLEFSEPILLSSLVPGTTVLVSHGPTGAALPGTVTKDPSISAGGRRFLFVPTDGLGADAADIHVALTTGITDLAGNPLQRPVGSASATQ
jgi:Bacterial Ig-like domain